MLQINNTSLALLSATGCIVFLASSYTHNADLGALLMNWQGNVSFTLFPNKSQSGTLFLLSHGNFNQIGYIKTPFWKNHVQLPYQQFLPAMPTSCILFSERTKSCYQKEEQIKCLLFNIFVFRISSFSEVFICLIQFHMASQQDFPYKTQQFRRNDFKVSSTLCDKL